MESQYDRARSCAKDNIKAMFSAKSCYCTTEDFSKSVANSLSDEVRKYYSCLNPSKFSLFLYSKIVFHPSFVYTPDLQVYVQLAFTTSLFYYSSILIFCSLQTL